jgi:hypothetical protein
LLGGSIRIAFLLRHQVIGALLLRHDIGIAPFLCQDIAACCPRAAADSLSVSGGAGFIAMCWLPSRLMSDALELLLGREALGALGMGDSSRGR